MNQMWWVTKNDTFGLWLKQVDRDGSYLKKKMRLEQRETDLEEENQVKNEKKQPVKCGNHKANRVKSFQQEEMITYIKC